MSKPEFVHLHTHSEYSLLDGACRLKDLSRKAAEMGMPALALTDHGVMYGAISFYKDCKDAGIKPIIGCEVYVAPRSRTSREPKLDSDPFHLVLLARNETGYSNLLKLVTAGYLEGFYYKPRVDKELLASHSEGLIAMSACIAGEVPDLCLKDNYEKAKESVGQYCDIFGSENFFLELQDHGLEEQPKANESLIRLARECDIRLVATNDIHYMDKKDAAAHEVLLCIQTSTTLDDPKRLRFGSNEFFFTTQEEMAKKFAHAPEALTNTLAVAEMCDLKLEFGTPQLPKIEIPEGQTPDSYLRELTLRGASARYPDMTDEIGQRVEYELEVVEKTGFAKYLLVVSDFGQFGRDNNILMGLRGSAASSVVCYALGISDVDPLKYGLMFERFLNIERVKMPDVDLDIADDRREELIRYVAQKYGEDHVAQIVTFGTLAARAAVRDVGRVLGMLPAEVDRVAKLIPSVPIGITIDRAIAENAELKKVVDENSQVKELVDMARQLEGISRHASTHAAGVIITAKPLTEHVPVQRAAKGELVCQYNMDSLESVGLLKMDFLGLANLTILAKCVENVRKTRGEEIDVRELPLDDARVYEMLSAGDTTGVFQLEGVGMRRHIQEVKPNSIIELAAMIALYRPGPMANIPQFIENKFSGKEIAHLHEKMAPVLQETYGVMVFQEDVLRTAQAIAGFSLGQADILRAAMSKKKPEEMRQAREKFMTGAEANGIPNSVAKRIFDVIEPFSGYAFNKAHAVCYAILAYRTAYMKCHYPVEYFAALIDAHVDNKDRLAQYVEESKRRGIEVVGPEVNSSNVEATVESGPPQRIRLGLSAVRNCSRALVEAVIKVRGDSGQFLSLHDLCLRVQEEGCFTRGAVEVLVKAGALSSMDDNRARLLACLDEAQAAASRSQRDKRNGQAGLFGEARVEQTADIAKPDMADFPPEEILAMEKELLGVYLSEHPLSHFKELLDSKTTITADQLQDVPDGQPCVVGGVITKLRHHVTKRKNERMAFITVEDFSGAAPVTVFPSAFKEYADQLMKDRIVIVRGKTSHREMTGGDDRSTIVEIVCESMEFPTSAAGQRSEHASKSVAEAPIADASRPIEIRLDGSVKTKLETLKEMLLRHPGQTPILMLVPCADGEKKVRSQFRVRITPDLIEDVKGLLGEDAVCMRES